MTEASPDPIQCARDGKHAYFKTVDPDVLEAKDDDGNSVLSTAAIHGHLACCKVIVKARSSLLNGRNNEGSTAFHHAAFHNRTKTLQYLLQECEKLNKGATSTDDTENGEKHDLLTALDNHSRTALHAAVQGGHLGPVKALIRADIQQKLRKITDDKGDTPMHLAVKTQNKEIVEFLAKEKPDLDYNANASSQTPHLIALEKALHGERTAAEIKSKLDEENPPLSIVGRWLCNLCATIQEPCGCSRSSWPSSDRTLQLAEPEKSLNSVLTAVDIRNFLIHNLPAQCKVSTDSSNWTLLHHAADKGDLNAIKEIISGCPGCLDWVDSNGQNVLHILAARPEHAEVGYTVSKLKAIGPTTLNWQDQQGNTPLHTAVVAENPRLAEALLYNPSVNIYLTNKQDERAFDKIQFEFDKVRAGFSLCEADRKDLLRKQEEEARKRYQDQIKDQAEVDLVVSTLIATVSFAAGIAVPGGYAGEGSNRGTAILAPKISFKVFMVSDVIALLLSLYAVLSHLAAKHITIEEDLLYQVKVARCCSGLAIFAMVAAFASAVYAVLAVTREFAIVICALCCIFFLFGLLPAWRIRKSIKKNILDPLVVYIKEKACLGNARKKNNKESRSFFTDK